MWCGKGTAKILDLQVLTWKHRIFPRGNYACLSKVVHQRDGQTTHTTLTALAVIALSLTDHYH